MMSTPATMPDRAHNAWMAQVRLAASAHPARGFSDSAMPFIVRAPAREFCSQAYILCAPFGPRWRYDRIST
jgi:hypothetical protein